MVHNYIMRAEGREKWGSNCFSAVQSDAIGPLLTLVYARFDVRFWSIAEVRRLAPMGPERDHQHHRGLLRSSVAIAHAALDAAIANFPGQPFTIERSHKTIGRTNPG
jgi:hypothetical protein